MGSSFLDEEDLSGMSGREMRRSSGFNWVLVSRRGRPVEHDPPQSADDCASMGSSFLDEEDVALGDDRGELGGLQWGPRFSTRKTHRVPAADRM